MNSQPNEATPSPNLRVPDEVLAAMASYFPAGIVSVRPDDTIGFMNAFAMRQVFDDAVGPGDDFAKLLAMCGEPKFQSSLSINKTGLDSLLVCVERGGTSTYYLLSTLPSRRDETVLMFQPAFPLIHEASAELVEQDEETRDADVINRLVGQVSHHVSTPLAYIVMNLEILKETMSDLEIPSDQADSRDDCEDLLSTVGDGVKRITQVVRALQAVNLGRLEPEECVEHLEERERQGEHRASR